MPRAVFAQAEGTAPLTVAKLAERVGVSTSTLRTWDRRYGLGPSTRTQGAHRRYSALDVARIELVVSLIEKGVSTCDAAKQALTAEDAEFDFEVQTDISVDQLSDACLRGNRALVRSMLERSITRDGLMRAWTDLIEPAREKLQALYVGELPGYCGSVFLGAQVLAVLRIMQCEHHGDIGKHSEAGLNTEENSECCDDSCAMETCHPNSPSGHSDCAKHVLLLSDCEHLVPAHVLGVALTWHNLDVRVIAVRSADIADAAKSYLERCEPRVVAFIGASVCHKDLVDQLANDESTEVVLVGTDVPCVLAPHVQRLRTLIAAAEEITVIAN